MKKRRAVGVSSVAGYTKNLQEVEIDSKVRIIDSPGVILSKEDEVTLVLRNQINPSEVKDPITPIEKMLKLINKEELLLHYKIPDFKEAKGFLLGVAQVRGKYIKGGIPNLEEAARVVIGDWSQGKIRYYAVPEGYVEEAGNTANNMSVEELTEIHKDLQVVDEETGNAMQTE